MRTAQDEDQENEDTEPQVTRTPLLKQRNKEEPRWSQPQGPPPPYNPPAGGSRPQQPTGMYTNLPRISTSLPMRTVCPYCGHLVVTETTPVPGILTWLLCLGLCFCGCCLGCCLVPFWMPSLKDVTHSCPVCKHDLYHFKRM
ncbi:LITAF domain-containing protein-like [Urocitellus parryii]